MEVHPSVPAKTVPEFKEAEYLPGWCGPKADT
jgi:hypothetical protein